MQNRRSLAVLLAPLVVLLIGASSLVGCIEPREPTVFQSIANNGMEEQGRFLLGTALDAWAGSVDAEHYSTSTKGTNAAGRAVTLAITRGSILSAVGGEAIHNVVLTGGPAAAPVKVRISVVEQEPPNLPTLTLTKVQLEVQQGTAWVPGPCGTGLAIPLAGVFRRDGLHVATINRLTFACHQEGVAAKCADWGYPPGTDAGDQIWRTHQACTRMARADICSNGRSNTRNATRIWFFDTIAGNAIPDATEALVAQPITTWPPPPSTYYFEAFWRAGSEHVGCLSKLRWQAAMPGALCNGQLPDPRLPPGSDGVSDACEGITIEDAIADRQAILFNKTQYSDLALGLWTAQLPDGGRDTTTTVRGFVGGGAIPTVHPFSEHVGEIYQPLRSEAFLLRVPPADRDPQEYVEVATFVDARGERVLARRSDPDFGPGSGYTFEFNEGYAFLEPQEGFRAALWIWHNPTTGDRVSLTSPVPPTPGYQKVKLVGFITDLDPIP
jgi:hypothetical protein